MPDWVQKRDGSVAPFDATEINRALYAATEAAGQPDPFVAQELTDSVLHFLAEDSDDRVLTSAHIKETLAKVVRELGHSAVAKALLEGRGRAPTSQQSGAPRLGPTDAQLQSWIASGPTPWTVQRRCAAAVLEQFALNHVYSENVAAAHREGLLILHGLESPLSLAAAVVRAASADSGPGRALGIFEAVEESRQIAGQLLALDSPERELAGRGLRIAEAASFVRELGLAARATERETIINLGCATAPDWEREWAPGPLFSGNLSERPERVAGHLDALLEPALQSDHEWLQIHWHLADRDFRDEPGRRRLLRLVRAAVQGVPVTFVCDRPNCPVSLAEGLDRRNPASLLWIGLNLPQLWQRLGENSGADDYLRKLESLVRLAVSAGVQKREFLRQAAAGERHGFVIDRAHLTVYLSGLPSLLQSLFGDDPFDADAPQSFFLQMASHLQEALAGAARNYHLTVRCEAAPIASRSEAATVESLPNDKATMAAVGRLHDAVGRGTACVQLTPDHRHDARALVDLLHFACKETTLHRMRFIPKQDDRVQLTVVE